MARPRSLRFRYSLRALLVVVTLFMLWGGYHTNHCWKERAADEVLRRHGFGCSYGPKKAGTGIWSEVRFGYQKVVQTIWRERFVTDAAVFSPPEAEVIDALVALPYLESLTLCPTRHSSMEEHRLLRVGNQAAVTAHLPEGSLSRILSQHKLRILVLSPWILSEDDCRTIAEHSTLEELNISGCRVSEEGFAELLTLPQLRYFAFAYCQVTGSKLKDVSGSTSLQVIDCQFAPVGNEFAAFVGRSPNISTLQCYHPAIDDRFLAAIGPHPSLENLNLGHTKVTDESVTLLQKMPSLKYLTIATLSVTEEGKVELLKANPALKVQ